MSTILRYVQHRIRSQPGTTPIVAARCLKPDCGWQSRTGLSVEDCDTACMAHTGRMGHRTFERTFMDVAVVERVQ